MRLIDADALVEYMNARVFDLREMYGDYDHYTDGFDDALQVVEDAPIVDAVPVVRCEKCKHNNERHSLTDGGVWFEYWGTDPDNDGFCYKGERRSND